MKRKPLRTRARENNPITVAVLRRLQSRACPVCGSKARERCFDIEKGGHVNGPWIHSERMKLVFPAEAGEIATEGQLWAGIDR